MINNCKERISCTCVKCNFPTNDMQMSAARSHVQFNGQNHIQQRSQYMHDQPARSDVRWKVNGWLKVLSASDSHNKVNLLCDNNVSASYQQWMSCQNITCRCHAQHHHDILVHWPRADPICSNTLSSHCSGPFKWTSIQHGVLVIVWRLQQSKSSTLLHWQRA